MARKTILIDALRNKANDLLAESTVDRELRLGVCLFIENILHETGNYKGYGHLNEDEVPKGEKPGVVKLAEKSFIFPDDSRRVYH